MIYNRQNGVRLSLTGLDDFAAQLARRLKLGRSWFDVAFVEDWEIQRLNRQFRGKNRPTDVLSFPWAPDGEPPGAREAGKFGLDRFLGDVIISAPRARQDAAKEGTTLDTALRQLMLHGALHLAGYDHETDDGEMHALELELRRRLRIDGSESRPRPGTAKSGRTVNGRIRRQEAKGVKA